MPLLLRVEISPTIYFQGINLIPINTIVCEISSAYGSGIGNNGDSTMSFVAIFFTHSLFYFLYREYEHAKMGKLLSYVFLLMV